MVVAQDDESDVAVQVMLSLSLSVVTEVGGVSLPRTERENGHGCDRTREGQIKYVIGDEGNRKDVCGQEAL